MTPNDAPTQDYQIQVINRGIPRSKIYGFLLGIFFFTLFNITPVPDPFTAKSWTVLSVVSLMLCWWISEAIPIPVTALLPIVLFPTLDIMPIKQATLSYGHYIVFLFMGGFVIALALEKWGIHKRISLAILKITGTRANGIIAGFMIATAFLSMWMSNTATTVMMLPIAASVLQLIFKDHHSNRWNLSRGEEYFGLTLMLGIAYAANIGGTATLIGTPPNAVLAGFMQDSFNYTIDFASWIQIGLPFSICMLIICWLVLTQIVYRNNLGHIENADIIIEEEWSKLGAMTRGEKFVLTIFLVTASLWMFKGLLGINISDTGIAIMAAITLFIVPVDIKKGEFILVWDDMAKLPWGILLLFGGGLSIAAAMSSSGLVEIIGDELSGLSTQGAVLLTLSIITVVLLMTELMSNVALISVFLPVLAALSIQLTENPLLFAIPATLASSCAFMLPMSTPPNAIVFASGYIRISQMVKAGVILNFISISLTLLLAFTLMIEVFDIEAGVLPDWALLKNSASQ